jgi:hypothetical protein
MKFTEHKDGLYVFDAGTYVLHGLDDNHNENGITVDKYNLVNTVSGNQAKYVSREIEAANKAMELYHILGRPSQSKFEDIIMKNVIINSTLNLEDAQRVIKV